MTVCCQIQWILLIFFSFQWLFKQLTTSSFLKHLLSLASIIVMPLLVTSNRTQFKPTSLNTKGIYQLFFFYPGSSRNEDSFRHHWLKRFKQYRQKSIYFSLSLSLHFRYSLVRQVHLMQQQRRLLAILDLYQSFFSLLFLIGGREHYAFPC